MVGSDPETDLAVLKIDPREEIPVIPFGHSDELQIGEWVVAIGNPFPEQGLDRTVTAGVVSAYRTPAPVYGICKDEQTARLLMLHWGITPVVISEYDHRNWDNMCHQVAHKLKLKLKQRSIIVLAGFGQASADNQPVLKILRYQ